jgi:hypothetical protein
LLKIDLLPGHFAAARAAKSMLFVMVAVLLLTILGCFGMLMMKKSELAKVTQERDAAKSKADEVRGIEADAQAKEGLAAPIDAKVTFIEDADGCGEQWWDALDKVNRYIYAQAKVTTIRITPPNAVHFEVDVPDTTSCGRFVLNLIRCPDITGIRIGGAPPGGEGIGPNARASGGGGGAMGGMAEGGMGGPMAGGMPGAPGAGPPGGMGGPMMGGGMPGMGGGAPAGGGSAAGGPIHLSVDATLTTALTTPAPGGGAAAAAGGMPGGAPGGGGMMGGGMTGAPGGSMMGPGGGMPGAGGGGGAAPGPPAGGGEGGGGIGSKAGGGEDAGGGDE